MQYIIREALPGDLCGLLKLYTHLNSNTMPVIDSAVAEIFEQMLSREGMYVLVAANGEAPVSTLTLSVIPSLTHSQRPYAVVEHVVTLPSARGRGIASALLAKAVEIANAEGCYKLMLITGQQGDTVHRLYRRGGFSYDGFTAYVRKL